MVVFTMSFKTSFAFVFSTFAFISFFFSSSAMACDDKACEAAYLATTQQYINNEIRHAKVYRAERIAHAKNRERRALALYMHIHQTRFGRFRSNTPVVKMERLIESAAVNKVSAKTTENNLSLSNT